MNVAELMCLLSPRVAAMERGSGLPAITTQDVLHAIAAIGPRDSTYHLGIGYFLRVKYAHQSDYQGILEEHLSKAIDDLWEQKCYGHPRERPGFTNDLCRLALSETIHPHICLRCGGWGSRVSTSLDREGNPGKILDCRFCRGTGRKPPTEMGRADILKMPRETWRRWSQPYQYIISMLNEWEEIGLRKAGKKLRRFTAK